MLPFSFFISFGYLVILEICLMRGEPVESKLERDLKV